jgi:methylmalonyl-CoA/ethylmalonyl-CoA epimerase
MTLKLPDLVKNITQVGIVVRDLDARLEHYAKLGVGPWRVYTYDAPRLTDTKLRGVPTPFSMKLALAWTKEMNWELIQPLSEPSIYWEFLRDHGEGMHHINVDCGSRPIEEIIEAFTKRGWAPLMEGNFLGTRFVYFGTEEDLTTIVEIRHAPPNWQRPEPDYWYPSAP